MLRGIYSIILLLLSAIVSARTPLLQSKPRPAFQTVGNWRGVYNLIPSKNKEKRAMWNIINVILL